jgi:hypothetical protein
VINDISSSPYLKRVLSMSGDERLASSSLVVAGCSVVLLWEGSGFDYQIHLRAALPAQSE